MRDSAIESPGRREFLRVVPVAAAAGLALTDALLTASPAVGQAPAPVTVQDKFRLFTAAALDHEISVLEAKPGTNILVDANVLPGTLNLVVEKATLTREYEWHEQTDHIVHVIDGSTVYEVGGTPQDPRSIGPGQWHATKAEGTTTITLNKNDLLVLPRNTMHKRTTPVSVTFMMVSPTGPVKA